MPYHLRRCPQRPGFWPIANVAALDAVARSDAWPCVFAYIGGRNTRIPSCTGRSHAPRRTGLFSSQRGNGDPDGSRFSLASRRSQLAAMPTGLALCANLPTISVISAPCGSCEKCLRTRPRTVGRAGLGGDDGGSEPLPDPVSNSWGSSTVPHSVWYEASRIRYK